MASDLAVNFNDPRTCHTAHSTACGWDGSIMGARMPQTQASHRSMGARMPQKQAPHRRPKPDACHQNQAYKHFQASSRIQAVRQATSAQHEGAFGGLKHYTTHQHRCRRRSVTSDMGSNMTMETQPLSPVRHGNLVLKCNTRAHTHARRRKYTQPPPLRSCRRTGLFVTIYSSAALYGIVQQRLRCNGQAACPAACILAQTLPSFQTRRI
jgi:hypothetical protein